MTKIIAVANQKGGVAKTTTSISLASSLVSLGYKVLLVDLDPQGNASRGVGLDISLLSRTIFDVLTGKREINRIIKNTVMKNLDIAPANLKLASIDDFINKEDTSSPLLLKNALSLLNDQYDYIIIDCPPTLGILNTNAFVASNRVLIPVQCEYFAMEAITQMLGAIRNIQNSLNPDLGLEGFVFTMFDARNKMSIEVSSEVRGVFKEVTFQTVIPRNVYLAEAASKGIPITVYKPKSASSLAYLALAKEMLDKELIEKRENKL